MEEVISAADLYYRELNARIREKARQGADCIRVTGVQGHRYIGCGLQFKNLQLKVSGVPGEDLGAFMDGPTVVVENNAQNGVGNTMNDGRILIHGMAGDVVGYGMRGGRIYIRDGAGYRVGIHMKGFKEKQPILVIGGKAGKFCGEYMAGGYLILLGATGRDTGPVVGDYCAAGMHGGTMYIRGQVEESSLGQEVKAFSLTSEDETFLRPILMDFLETFSLDINVFDFDSYRKIVPVSTRPYGKLYAY